MRKAIKTDEDVFVAADEVIEGDIEAQNIRVAGKVFGNLTARQEVEILASGTVQGDLCAQKVLVAEGAHFKGHVDLDLPSMAKETEQRRDLKGTSLSQETFMEDLDEVIRNTKDARALKHTFTPPEEEKRHDVTSFDAGDAPRAEAAGEPMPETPGKPNTDVEWELWHRDTFDRSSSIDIRGRGLVEGIRELWTRYLYEQVSKEGWPTFSSFILCGKERFRSIEIEDWGERLLWDGAVKLRAWVFDQERDRKDGDSDLLNLLAFHHTRLFNTEKPSAQILRIAGTSMSRKEFEQRLEDLHAETACSQKADDEGEGNKANLQEVCEIFEELRATYPDLAARYNVPSFLQKVAELAAEAGRLGENIPDFDERISLLHEEASSIFQTLKNEIATMKLTRKIFMDVINGERKSK